MRKHLLEKDPGRLLVFKEKHARRYFLAETKEQLCAIALSILKERMKGNCQTIYKPDPESSYNPEELLTAEQIAALPTSLQAHATNQARDAARYKRQYDEAVRVYTLAKEAMKEKNGEKAWDVLEARSDYEYEGYTFEYLEKP